MNNTSHPATFHFMENGNSLFIHEESARFSMRAFSGIEDSDIQRLPLTPSEVEFERVRRSCWWSLQYRLRAFTEHIAVRLTILLLLIIDIGLMIVEIILVHNKAIRIPLLSVSLGICLIFLVEIIMRMIVWGLLYWKNIVNCIDLVIVIALLAISCVDIALEGYPAYTKVVMILRFIRLPRLIQVIRVIYTQREFLSKSTRLVVSQNKRRYTQDGFDLDLCYVTDRVIAMSFPSSGFLAFYRNPIEEVSRFLDSKHFGRYWVYNLCSERSYEITFFHDRVDRYMIDDHNVPFLIDMIDFAKKSLLWLEKNPKNIIAVHCKGGKGRTGTMICAHLIYSGEFLTAEECLEYFGQQRTDLSKGNTYQGVETPSQFRYVGYFEIIKAKNIETPEETPLKLISITLNAITGVGKGDGTDFSVEIFIRKERIFSSNLKSKSRLNVTKNEANDQCIITDFNELPVLAGDIKMSFRSSNSKVPRGYEKRPFFFWFHTGFVNKKSLRLVIPRNELDNLHKSKTWHVFRDNFSVELLFEMAQPPQ
jgi:PTEN homologous phosphatase